ncbi:hypothetical protein [Rhodanobacter sp. C03]|uniref:hypothetical protein n=1 Tax=Rhodanobacter sp. C03 TaxID=1945858 RepID=UPI0014390F50|nr:hypothetical protein [Rhodanobacter sp. C03]
MNLPQAATAPLFVFSSRTRERPRERGLHVVAALGALLVHLICLFAFVLGPAYEVKPPPESKQQFLQVRLIEAPEPPPPPPVLGTPPKELGPRHQGRASRPIVTSQPGASMQMTVAPPPKPSPAPPVVAQAVKSSALAAKPVAAPTPPVSLPQPAPTPQLQPVPLAAEPPAVNLPTPSLQPPVPPKFQPESVRRPQLEGTRPLPPPASLALPELPTPASPPITVSSIALTTVVPKSSAPPSVTPERAEVPAAPPVPELQPIPLPAQPAPTVNLQTSLSVPSPSAPHEQPQLQAPKIEVAEAELEAVPLAPAAPAQVRPQVPVVKIEPADKAIASAIQPSIERPQLTAPPAPVVTAAAQPAPTNKSAAASASTASAKPAATASPDETSAERDVSTAPNASPSGSDTATPGVPNGVAAAPESAGNQANGLQPKPGQGSSKGVAGKQQGPGQLGGNQPGAAEGAKQGEPNGYVQLKPHGDTEIMGHGTPNIGYKPTRFDSDWTPEGESSVDTVLRHAVEKTTVAHTFHLPRGVRVECKVVPLLPMALFGCDNPDPPPKPVAAKVYDRLHLAPANPVAAPTPAASASTAAATPIKLDNSVQCAEARVAGGPPPPGCEAITLPVKLAHPATPSSSTWVPASDQFH